MKIAGWAAVVLSVLILLVFASIRLSEMRRPPAAADAFGIRYIENPRIALLHIVPGLVFLALAPLQFVTRIRQRHIQLHRRLGWVMSTCAALAGVFALVIAVRFPAFGGITTQAATFCFGVLFLFSVAKAIRHVRHKEVAQHREWMIRAYALGMGAATIRLIVGLLVAVFGYEVEQVFGISFWLGFTLNLLLAEIWIRSRRRLLIAPTRKTLLAS